MSTLTVTSITDQGSGKSNEDVLVIEEKLFGIFDGASSLVSYVSPEGKSGGRLAADIASGLFLHGLLDLMGMITQANQAINEAEREAGIDTSDKASLWGTTVSVVRLDGDALQFVKIGNSPVLVLYEDGHHQILGEDDNHDLETLQLWQKLAGKEKDPWESMRAQNIKIRNDVNRTYGVLNGEQAAEKFIQHGSLPLKGIQSVILLSDGLLIPKVDPNQDEEWNTFTELYYAGGLPHVLRHIRSMEDADPDAWQYPRLKKHDDASAIAIDFAKVSAAQSRLR